MNKIEEKYGMKSSHAFTLFAILILNAISFICNLIMNNGQLSIQICFAFIIFVAVAFYALYDYKRPHGNNMRYLLLAYAISVAGLLSTSCKVQPTYLTINYLVVIILSTYMAGRLDRYKQNLYISIILLVCAFISFFSLVNALTTIGLSVNVVNIMACFGAVTQWLAITASYIIRFKPHKEAGLEDKK